MMKKQHIVTLFRKPIILTLSLFLLFAVARNSYAQQPLFQKTSFNDDSAVILIGEWILDVSAVEEIIRQSSLTRESLCGQGWSEKDIQERIRMIISAHSDVNPVIEWSIYSNGKSVIWNNGKQERIIEGCTRVEQEILGCKVTPELPGGPLNVRIKNKRLSVLKSVTATDLNCRPTAPGANAPQWWEAFRLRKVGSE